MIKPVVMPYLERDADVEFLLRDIVRAVNEIIAEVNKSDARHGIM